MNLIKDEVQRILQQYYDNYLSSQSGHTPSVMVDSHDDLLAALEMLNGSQTIVFSADQLIALLPAVRKFEESLDIRLPFPRVVFQLDTKLSNNNLFLPEVEGDDDDNVMAIIASQIEEDGALYNNAVVWFESTKVNRALWKNESSSELIISKTADDIAASLGENVIYQDAPPNRERQAENKETVRLLVCAMCAYINSANMELEHVAPSQKVQAKRRKKGKRELPDYYMCQVKKEFRQSHGSGTGAKHSHRYDVRGHFRRMADGRVLWVHPHQRGLANEQYKPKVYKA